MKKKKSNKRFTVSTYVFKSLREAEEQIQEWSEDRTLRKDSCVFEVVARYKPVLKLIKVREYAKTKTHSKEKK